MRGISVILFLAYAFMLSSFCFLTVKMKGSNWKKKKLLSTLTPDFQLRAEAMRALSSELGLPDMMMRRRDGFCISEGSEKSTHLEFERCGFGSLFAPEGPSPMRKRAIITKLWDALRLLGWSACAWSILLGGRVEIIHSWRKGIKLFS